MSQHFQTHQTIHWPLVTYGWGIFILQTTSIRLEMFHHRIKLVTQQGLCIDLQ